MCQKAQPKTLSSLNLYLCRILCDHINAVRTLRDFYSNRVRFYSSSRRRGNRGAFFLSIWSEEKRNTILPAMNTRHSELEKTLFCLLVVFCASSLLTKFLQVSTQYSLSRHCWR